MERLIIKKCGELLVNYNDGEYRSPCFGCESINECNPEKVTCGFYKALEKLTEYEDMQDKLDDQFNGCINLDSVIDMLIEYDKQLERNEKLAKAMLITNDSVRKFREWEDLEEQGKLLKLPCAVGNKVYLPNKYVGKVIDFEIIEICIFKEEIMFIDDSENEYFIDDFGKTVFATKEEAEAALKIKMK